MAIYITTVTTIVKLYSPAIELGLKAYQHNWRAYFSYIELRFRHEKGDRIHLHWTKNVLKCKFSTLCRIITPSNCFRWHLDTLLLFRNKNIIKTMDSEERIDSKKRWRLFLRLGKRLRPFYGMRAMPGIITSQAGDTNCGKGSRITVREIVFHQNNAPAYTWVAVMAKITNSELWLAELLHQ